MADFEHNRLDQEVTDIAFIKKLESLACLVKKVLRYRPKTIKNYYSQTGFEFSEYKKYTPGDDLRSVDWNIYNRLGEIVTKEYFVEQPRHWIIILDTSKSMLPGYKYQFAKQLAAAIMYIGLSLSDRITFTTYPGSFSDIKKYNGRAQVKTMLNNLADLECSHQVKTYSFDTILSKLPKHSIALIISDFYERDAFFALFPMLKIKEIHSLALPIISKEERFPDFTGNLLLEDIESNEVYKLYVGKSRISKYQKQLKMHLEQLRYYCLKHEVSYKEFIPKDIDKKSILSILKLMGLLK